LPNWAQVKSRTSTAVADCKGARESPSGGKGSRGMHLCGQNYQTSNQLLIAHGAYLGQKFLNYQVKKNILFNYVLLINKNN